MKIKTKKEMNLPQLIEWAMENEIKNKDFESNDGFSVDTVTVEFDYLGRFGSSYNISKAKKFTVEVEEEITEDTVISEILTIYDKGVTDLTNNKSLNDLIENNLKSAYIMNDDLRLILILRDGKLVE